MSKVFCAAPWNHLFVFENAFGLCCISKYRNESSSTLAEHWNSEGMKKIRVQMMNGTPPEDHCRSCINSKFTNSVVPQSFYHNQKAEHLVDEMLSKTSPDGHTTFEPKTIDLRTDLCNLKCRTCGPASSTSIRQEMIRFDLPIMPKKNELLVGVNDEIVKNLEHIIWAGGEPFMSPIHWDVMDKLIAFNNTNVIIWYNTNLTFPGKTLKRAVDTLGRFPNIYMGASLDAVEEDGEYIRDGLKYKTFVKNLSIFEPIVHLNISFTGTSIGMLSLDKIIRLCLDTNTNFNGSTVKLDFKSDHALLVNVLKKEVLEDCLSKAIDVAKGTRLEETVSSYCNFVLNKYSPIIPDLESNRFQESMRGKVGYFNSRMDGLING